MSFLKSIFLGSEGTYNIFGIEADFQKIDRPKFSYTPSEGSSRISKFFMKSVMGFADKCLRSRFFGMITQGPLHTFVHEMGHALAVRLLTDQKPIAYVYTNVGQGSTYFNHYQESAKVNSLIAIAGPMADMTFSSINLVAAAALKEYISTPVALTIGSSSVLWMSGELLLALVTTLSRRGDFGMLLQNGSKHFTLAATALVGESILGMVAAYSLL